MSLDWDCEDCEDPIAANEIEAGIRKALVFESMAVCLGRISEENEDEWMFRVMLLQLINQSTIMFAEDTWGAKARELRKALSRWRGMTTNASHKPKRKEWMQQTMALLEKDVERRLPKVEKVANTTEDR
jgi:hypothetical protein